MDLRRTKVILQRILVIPTGPSQGIGADFIDGEPNIKYMPQKPVQLRDSLWSQSQACMNEIVPETPSPYPKRPLSSSFPRSGATEAQTLEDGQAYRRGPPVTRKSRGDGTPSDRRPSSTPRLAPDPICGRPQSSKAIGGRMVRSQRDSPTENHTDSAFAGEVWQAARELRPRQKTANGREVQLPRFCVPHLDDPADPAMIANRYFRSHMKTAHELDAFRFLHETLIVARIREHFPI